MRFFISFVINFIIAYVAYQLYMDAPEWKFTIAFLGVGICSTIADIICLKFR